MLSRFASTFLLEFLNVLDRLTNFVRLDWGTCCCLVAYDPIVGNSPTRPLCETSDTGVGQIRQGTPGLALPLVRALRQVAPFAFSEFGGKIELYSG